LDYVVEGYDSSTCDLWEEVQSSDFFWNRFTMHKAMVAGTRFAIAMGDSDSADRYAATAEKLAATLHDSHWTGSFVQEESSRQKDGAVIVAFNDGFDVDDKGLLFAPSGADVASTVGVYNRAFCAEYSVNRNDTAAAVPGVLYGRYPGDTYAGGNPWVLTTAALAQLLFRAGTEILLAGGTAVPSSDVLALWADALNQDEGSLPTEAVALANVFATAGDSVLLRLRSHVTAREFHLDEQIDRDSGEQMSAKDLTWSYAEVLSAMHQREVYFSSSSVVGV
jgi:glucoamylase